MADSKLTEVKACHFDWSQATSDFAGGFACFLRLCINAVGLVTLAAVVLLIGMPEARDQLAQLVPASMTARAEFSMISLPAVDPEPTVLDRIRSGRAVLNPGDAHAAQYLARRYRVADDAVRVLVAAAREIGTEKQVDPLLILAVMAVESSMNPFAQSPVGAQGLMQVMTNVHGGKFEAISGEMGALDPISNIKVGSTILCDLIRRGGSVERGLQLYVGAGNQADDGGYANRVMSEFARLKMAAAGNVESALAAGLRADAKSAGDPTAGGAALPGHPAPEAFASPVGESDPV